MTKALVVSYTPRDNSNSARLLQTYLDCLPVSWEVDVLDLLETPAAQHSRATVNALLKRNFAQLPLDDSEQQAVHAADAFLQRLLESDHIVVAYPFYNFSVPAAVKAWLDTVIQKDRTFEIDAQGQFSGLCQGKQALLLMSSGGDYELESMRAFNLATPLMQNCFGLMGIPSTAICASGMDAYPDRAEAILAAAQEQIRTYVEQLVRTPDIA